MQINDRVIINPLGMEKTLFTIIQKSNGETFYLNHSCMASLSFGDVDMAWSTPDKEKAELMLNKVTAKHSDGFFKVVELL